MKQMHRKDRLNIKSHSTFHVNDLPAHMLVGNNAFAVVRSSLSQIGEIAKCASSL